jgi:DDE superfamily endonuclease
VDYAQALENLSDRHFPNAKKIVLVQDNLNTHKPASLYEAFSPDKARRLVERFEWHYTPKHGSWLDMAESELTVLASLCLDCRIHDFYDSNPEAVGFSPNRGQAHSKSMRFKSSISSDNVPSAVARP